MRTRFGWQVWAGLAALPLAVYSQTLPLTQDAYVIPGSGTNYGTATTVDVGGASAAQGLVQFDLTSLAAIATASNIGKATLILFVNKLSAAGTINISEASGAWTETGVNGTNNPVPGSAVASAVSVSVSSDYIAIDATQAVKDWLSGTPNSGFIITPSDGLVSVLFDSKESTTTSHPAQLTVLLNPAGGAIGATGPTGPTGAAGSIGPAGATGAVGATGTAGPAGATGAVGATGTAGPAGATGAVGATGTAGPAGATGAVGATGTAGPAGATGAVGATGVAGPAGAAGATGAAGAKGATGATGSAGPAGTNGTNGATGPTGPAGSNGTGASPTGIPLSVGGQTGTAVWNRPGGSVQQTTLNAEVTAIAPTTCTPSLKVWSYTGATTTWVLATVNPSTGTWTVGTSLISFTTASTPGSVNSQTAGSSVAAGTVMTLTSNSTSSPTAPGGGGFIQAFSCQ